MDETEVLRYVGRIEGLLKKATNARRALEQKLTEVEGWAKASSGLQQEIERSVSAAESTLAGIETVVRSLEGGAEASATDQSGLSPAFESITDEAEEVLRAEAIESIESIRLLPDEFADRIDGLIEDCRGKAQASNDWLEERIEALVAASAAIREKAEALAETINETRDELVEKTGEASAGMVEILEAFSALSREQGDALVEFMAERLEQAISDKIDGLTDGTLNEINEFADRVHDFAGQITEHLSGINETFGKIDQITRPIQPVLEMAGSIA